MPLNIFLDCLYDADYDGLVVHGQFTVEELKVTWDKIYLEYAKIADDNGYNELLDKYIQINAIYQQIFLINHCAKHLQVAYSEEVVNVLHKLGLQPGITKDDTTIDRIMKVNLAVKRAKKLIIELELLEKEYDELVKLNDAKSGGRDVFEYNLLTLSEYRKYAVRAQDITVRQYVKALHELQEDNDRLKIKSMQHAS